MRKIDINVDVWRMCICVRDHACVLVPRGVFLHVGVCTVCVCKSNVGICVCVYVDLFVEHVSLWACMCVCASTCTHVYVFVCRYLCLQLDGSLSRMKLLTTSFHPTWYVYDIMNITCDKTMNTKNTAFHISFQSVILHFFTCPIPTHILFDVSLSHFGKISVWQTPQSLHFITCWDYPVIEKLHKFLTYRSSKETPHLPQKVTRATLCFQMPQRRKYGHLKFGCSALGRRRGCEISELSEPQLNKVNERFPTARGGQILRSQRGPAELWENLPKALQPDPGAEMYIRVINFQGTAKLQPKYYITRI